MLNALFALFEKSNALNSVANIVIQIHELLQHFETDSIKDKDGKNAAIDAVCEILQAHKDK